MLDPLSYSPHKPVASKRADLTSVIFIRLRYIWNIINTHWRPSYSLIKEWTVCRGRNRGRPKKEEDREEEKEEIDSSLLSTIKSQASVAMGF